MPQVEEKVARTTTFNLGEYAGEHNCYDTTKLHPMHHTLIIREDDGTERSIAVGQLALFLQYAENHPNMGSALDAVVNTMKAA